MNKGIAFMACLLASVPLASALADYSGGSVDISRITNYYENDDSPQWTGGEFTLSNSILSIAAYSSKTSGIGSPANSFQTFCLERTEHILPPDKANVTVSTTFIKESDGSLLGPGSHAVLGGKTYGDNLDAATAYLYYKFAKGTLGSYNYTPGEAREESAKQLQNAIWYLEGEIGAVDSGSQAESWVTEAQGSGWTTIGNVRVLNLWTWNADKTAVVLNQDMLYLVPAPGAAVLGFLGIGIIGWVKRRLA